MKQFVPGFLNFVCRIIFVKSGHVLDAGQELKKRNNIGKLFFFSSGGLLRRVYFLIKKKVRAKLIIYLFFGAVSDFPEASFLSYSGLLQ